MTLEEQISAAEAVLFASGEPVRIDALLQALEIAPEEFEPVLRGLALRYGDDWDGKSINGVAPSSTGRRRSSCSTLRSPPWRSCQSSCPWRRKGTT